MTADGLAELCEKLLALYQSEEYKRAFSEIQNIVPVRDPARIEALNARLVAALRVRHPDLNITVPEIINYSDNLYVGFSGAGGSLVYDDVYIGAYYDYLDRRQIDLAAMGINDLRRHSLLLTDEDGVARERYSIFKSLVFDAIIEGARGETFHLSEGNWYRIDDGYIARLVAYLDPLCVNNDLPPYDHSSEGEYNASLRQATPPLSVSTKRTSAQKVKPSWSPATCWPCAGNSRFFTTSRSQLFPRS